MIGAEVYPVPAVAYENPLNYNHLARDYATKLENAFWTNQFDNTANANVHYVTTGPEIWEQMEGKVDGFICSTGTGGTLAGVGKFLKEKSGGKTQIWLADPPGSVLTSYILSGGTLVERTGSSITEGNSFYSLVEIFVMLIRRQELVRDVSPLILQPLSMNYLALSLFLTPSQLPCSTSC